MCAGPHTPAPTESDATQPPAGFPPSRSAEYHKLTKYTPRHLPVAESDTHGQVPIQVQIQVHVHVTTQGRAKGSRRIISEKKELP